MNILQSLQQGFSTFFGYIPQLIGAIVILIVGYIIAKVLEAVVTRLLRGVGFEHWMERGGVKQFFDRAETGQTPSSILGKVAFWFVFIIAITMAANALGIRQISGFLNQMIAYIPSIFAAVLILFLAALLANFVSGIVRGATGSDILAKIAQYAIIVYAVFAALTQLGIAVQLTAPTFLILLGAVALAAAIAFGWGARNVAQEIVERAYHRRGEVSGGASAGGATAGGVAREPSDDRYEEGRDLAKLSDSDFVLRDRAQDLRGRDVYDVNNDEIGTVRELYVDRQEQRVSFLDVSAGGTLGVGKKRFLIPYDVVSDVREDRVRLGHDRDRVMNAPEFDQEAEPDRRYQREVYRHYGLAQ